jgi:hypothetical protein
VRREKEYYVNIIAGVTEVAVKTGSFNTAFDQVVRIAAPRLPTGKDLTKIRRDCEILVQRIQKEPGKVQELLKAGLAGNMLAGRKLLGELKLTEKDFEAEGGGCWFFVVLAVIVILFVVTWDSCPCEDGEG